MIEGWLLGSTEFAKENEEKIDEPPDEKSSASNEHQKSSFPFFVIKTVRRDLAKKKSETKGRDLVFFME